MNATPEQIEAWKARKKAGATLQQQVHQQLVDQGMAQQRSRIPTLGVVPRLTLLGGVDIPFQGYANSIWQAESGIDPKMIRLRCIGAIGDVIYAAAVAAAVRKRNTQSRIVFETGYPVLVEGNPHIDEVVLPGAEFRDAERLIEVREEIDWQPRRHRLVHFAEMAEVSVEDAEFWVPYEEVAGLPSRYLAFHVGPTGLAEWVGRNWLPDRWHALAEGISKEIAVVAVGADKVIALPDVITDLRGRTNIRQTAGIIKGAHTFVGIESFPSTVAQAFGVPCVLFYGSIVPELRVFRDNVSLVRSSGLPCLGCHHDEQQPTVTRSCKSGGEPCQTNVSVDQFAAAVRKALCHYDGSRSDRIVIPVISTAPTQTTSMTISEPELVLDVEHGIAYQSERTASVEYGKAYFEKYHRMEGSAIATALNEFRISLAAKYGWKVLDVGIGSGEFVRRANMAVLGYDVNPYAIEWLKTRGQFCDPYGPDGIPGDITVVTMWDVLEHMPEPDEFLALIRYGCRLLVSIPIFDSLDDIRQSRHYRPNEHYWYFTRLGFSRFMADRGFECVEVLDDETRAGRESILTFVFCKRRQSESSVKGLKAMAASCPASSP